MAMFLSGYIKADDLGSYNFELIGDLVLHQSGPKLVNSYLRIKEYLKTVFTSIRGLDMTEMDVTPTGRACPTAVNLLIIKWCPIFVRP